MDMEKPFDPNQEYPPDPHWGKDRRGWWRYTDYDGESVTLRRTAEGDLQLDKHGEGFVFIRQEDIPLIIAAMTTREMYGPRRRRVREVPQA
jgi:hypothetical protein